MKEIEFSRWLFELPAKQHSQFSPSGSTFLHCLCLPSKSHREKSISSIFLESIHQVDMKNVVKSSKHFFGYFNTLETQSDKSNPLTHSCPLLHRGSQIHWRHSCRGLYNIKKFISVCKHVNMYYVASNLVVEFQGLGQLN